MPNPRRPRRAAVAAVLGAAVLVAGTACSSGDQHTGSAGHPTTAGAPGAQTPGGQPPGTQPAKAPLPGGSGGSHMVALGDSYAAGVNIPDQVGSPGGCSRSDHDYPSLVAKALGETSFTDVTCGGAKIPDFSTAQKVNDGSNPPQFNALGPDTRVVTVGISGNDIGFSEIVTTCVLSSMDTSSTAPCKARFDPQGNDTLKQRVDQTGPKLADALKQIRQRAPQARILVVGYPAILPESGPGCHDRLPIASGDLDYLRTVLRSLNVMLQTQARGAGAEYVDTYTPGIGHDVCQATGTRWIEGIRPEQPAAPVHPNALGQQGMANAVLARLR